MPLIFGIIEGTPVVLHEPYDSVIALAPLLYYHFDGVASPVPNLGSAVSKDLVTTNVTFGQPPISEVSDDTSAGFNGTTSFGTAVDPVLSGAAPVFSAGVWFQMTDTTLTFRHLIQQQDSTGNNGGFRLYLYGDGRAFAEGKTGTGAQDFTLSMGELFPTILSGDLTLVGVTATATSARLYVNGVQVLTTTRLNTGQAWPATSDIFVGRDYDTTDYFKGDISDAFITNTEITADGWAALYEVARSVSRPAYDNFADAFVFDPTVDTTEPFVLTNASTELNELAELFSGGVKYSRSLWATCTPAVGQTLNVASSSGTAQHVIHVYSGTALDSLTLVDTIGNTTTPTLTNNDTVALTGGTTYYLRIGGYLDDSGTVSLTVGPPPPPPANDNFADAIAIDTTTLGSIGGTCLNATNEPSEPPTWLQTGGGIPLSSIYTVWYNFTADATGNITFGGDPNPDDGFKFIEIDAFTGATLGTLTEVATNDPLVPSSTFVLAVTNGTEYHIRVTTIDVGVPSPYVGVPFTINWTDIT